MKKTAAVLMNVLCKLAEPKNVRIMMFLLPVLIGIGSGSGTILEVGGNPGGCSGG